MLHADERRLRGLITERAMTIQNFEASFQPFMPVPAFRRLFEHGNKARIVNDLVVFPNCQAADEITLQSLQSQVLHHRSGSIPSIASWNNSARTTGCRMPRGLPNEICALHEAMQGIRHELKTPSIALRTRSLR